MKYIAFLEVCPENLDKFVENYKKRISSKRTLKSLFPPHTIAKTTAGFTGFIIFESEDEVEIADYVTSYTLAGAKVKVYPIWAFTKGLEVLEK